LEEPTWNGSPDALKIAEFADISTLYCVEYPSPTSCLAVIRLDTPDLVSVTFGYGLEPQLVADSHKQFGLFPHPLA